MSRLLVALLWVLHWLPLPLLAALALLLAGGSPALPGAARAQLSAGE